MISAVFAFAAAMLVSVLLTPLVRKYAIGVGVVDLPGERRVHEHAIPRLGGLAIVAGFFVSLLGVFVAESAVAQLFLLHPLRPIGLAIGGLFICAAGVLDDVRGVRAWHKLAAQCIAGVIAYLCGFRIDAIALPFFGNLDMGVFGLFVTTFWIVAIINAINLIDGLDGLAGGVAFFACVTNFVVGFINQDPIVLLLSASLGGAVLGFLLFNFNPASIFMGDSGSMFLGYVLATTSILGNSVKSSTTVALLVPLVALGLPIMDTLLAMVRRFLERRSIFSADRSHIHHQLLAMGLTHRRAVLILYGLSILFTASSIVVSIGRNAAVGAALVLITVAVIGVIRALGNFDVALRRWRRSERTRTPALERLRYGVPAVLSRLGDTRELREITGVFRDFAELAGLEIIELSNPGELALLAPFRCTRAKTEDDNSEHEGRVTATYPVAAAGANALLHFSWSSTSGEVGPEADILLQLVVDAFEASIMRSSEARRSGIAPRLRSVQALDYSQGES
jgi:UDP-GlcNAc:undecaprenyl-phosphate/decaprenyl-phosphate GlcNAc-1-phosphate transferase